MKAIEEVEPHIHDLVANQLNSKWIALRLLDGDKLLLNSIDEYLNINISDDEILLSKLDKVRMALKEEEIHLDDLRDRIVSNIVKTAEDISSEVVSLENKSNQLDRKIDRVLTSKALGIPIMIALLGLVFWLTIEGANVPSAILAKGLFWIEDQLTVFFSWLGTPIWIHDILVLGMFRTLAWVISVMLPPMAIFFPLFTLLEDLGYLPRIAFNLDHFFKKACAHGKQALTMCMGFGCNAAGVIACRIIDSPRE